MIKVEDLTFSYNKSSFIEHMCFEVDRGEICGFLGPSGAGKSTLQKILTGLITDYSGRAVVNGQESKAHNADFYEEIGIDFEFPSLYEKLTARENLQFFGSLYQGEKRDPMELLRSVGLEHEADKKAGTYSKGMKSRLNFIKALLHNPKILFLDEPTSGLDPSNSRQMKDLILKEKENGKTIILTTHNMQDATELCDRVAFIVDGKIKAFDSPHNLIMGRGAIKLVYTYMDGTEKTAECMLNQTAKDEKLLRLIASNQIKSIHSSEPTLNDIFIEVTGRGLQ